MPKQPPAGKGLNAKTGGVKHKYWLIGGGVIALGYIYYQRQAAASSTTTAADPGLADSQPSGYDPTAGYDTGYGTGTGGAYGVTPSAAQTDAMMQTEADTATALSALASAFSAPVETNQDWMHEAIKSLEAHGYTYWQARHAVADYLAGAPLTTKQAHTIETAVGRIGPPPMSAPPIVITNPHNGNAGATKTRGNRTTPSGESSKTHNKALAAKPPVTVAGKRYRIGGFGVLKPIAKHHR